MPNALGLPTDADLAADLAGLIFDLSGLGDDIDGLRFENQKETLLVFAEIFREMDSRGNHCNLKNFSGLFFVLKEESQRLNLRARLSDAELGILRDALFGAALEITKRQRLRPV